MAVALIGAPASACGGAHERPVPQADLHAPPPANGDSTRSPPAPSGPYDGSCAAVERIARRYLADPDDGSPRRIALRREVQQALDACHGDHEGAGGRS